MNVIIRQAIANVGYKDLLVNVAQGWYKCQFTSVYTLLYIHLAYHMTLTGVRISLKYHEVTDATR